MSDLGTKARSFAVPLVTFGTAAAILWAVNGEYPIREWLLLRVLGYWALSLYWGLGCLGTGLTILGRVAPRQYRPSEAPFLAFPLGVLAFGIVVFGVGLVHGLGLAFFILAPAAFLRIGATALANEFTALRPVFRRLNRPWSWTELAGLVFGACGMVAVYVPILTPHNMEHDARWYHLPIAQQYAALGAVTRFPEGWFLGTYPHLATYLYTWAFLLPAGIVHRIELCAHLEFVVFVVTVMAIPAMVRRILPGVRVPLAWAGFFLFPGFLVYDSNLSVGADHIAAVFAPLGFLALYPTLRTLSPRHAALVGAAAAGAATTKYSAFCVAAPLLAFVSARAFYVLSRRRHVRRALFCVASLLGVFAVLSAPHFLANALWYGNPLYPMMSDTFPSRPWDNEATMTLRVFLQWGIVRPTQDLSGLLETLRAALTLGFVQRDTWHETVPIFGFLFAATLYCLPFTRPTWRMLVAHGLGFSAAFVWYFTNHHDRYLQACLPWLVAATMGVLVTLHRAEAAPVRVGATLLVAVQVIAGAGLSLMQSYFMIPIGHPETEVMSLVDAGYRKKYAGRFEPFEEWNFSA